MPGASGGELPVFCGTGDSHVKQYHCPRVTFHNHWFQTYIMTRATKRSAVLLN